jgi:hypothetical protein
MFSARNPVAVHANQAAGREHTKAFRVSNRTANPQSRFKLNQEARKAGI